MLGEQTVKLFISKVETTVGPVGAFFRAGIDTFKLFTQITDKSSLISQVRQILIALIPKGIDKFSFKLRFSLQAFTLFVSLRPLIVVGGFGTVTQDGEGIRAEDAFSESLGRVGVIRYGFHGGAPLHRWVECVDVWATGLVIPMC